jgi:prevent-host-death family protein
MKTVTITEFRSRASGMFTEVEHGEKLIVSRHGRPIAEVSPVENKEPAKPSWKKPALRLSTKGKGLSEAIIEERKCESIF